MKYKCNDCKYKFSPKTDRVPTRCPFCSSYAIQPEESAQELIDSVGQRQIPDQ